MRRRISEVGPWFHSIDISRVNENYSIEEKRIFEKDGYPAMYFVEHQYSNEPTSWWVPNRAGVEAMQRSSGFEIVDQPEEETYICKQRSQHG